MQPNPWLPLTEYALRSGTSISTLRRKIKANSIDYKMEEGRYLLRWDEDAPNPTVNYASSDRVDEEESDEDFEPTMMASAYHAREAAAAGVGAGAEMDRESLHEPVLNSFEVPAEILQLRREMQGIRDEATMLHNENSIRWRALETRVAGLAKKLDLFTEQFAELKMLVKLFEEKLDRRG